MGARGEQDFRLFADKPARQHLRLLTALAAWPPSAQLSLPAPTATGEFSREKALEPGGPSLQGQGGHPWLLTGVPVLSER